MPIRGELSSLLAARTAVFVSHANPEDNAFARWLSLQLAQQGYTVWSDLVRLRGGEAFWNNIENSIRRGAAKFLYVLSKASNQKNGPRQELSVAVATARQDKLTDFIIPIRIDNLPFSAMNIELARLNAIDFERGWAAGLHQLLEKLESEQVPRRVSADRSLVAEWWRNAFSATAGVEASPEPYLTNWFPFDAAGQEVFFHEIQRTGIGPHLPSRDLGLPAVEHGTFLIALGSAANVSPLLPTPYRIARTMQFAFVDFIGGGQRVAQLEQWQRKRIAVDLLRQTWELSLPVRGLGQHRLANGRLAGYVKQHGQKAIHSGYQLPDGRSSWRALTGFHTLRTASGESRRRIWHYGVSLSPLLAPMVGFGAQAHVFFSDDGRTLWDNDSRMHAARRSQCANWWNEAWRDRLLAFMYGVLGDGSAVIRLPLGGAATLALSAIPLTVESDVSYRLVDSAAEPNASSAELADEDDYSDLDENE
jgi:hypothetical protein